MSGGAWAYSPQGIENLFPRSDHVEARIAERDVDLITENADYASAGEAPSASSSIVPARTPVRRVGERLSFVRGSQQRGTFRVKC